MTATTGSTWMREVLAKNIPIWDACADTPFLRELQSGALPSAKFVNYMIQDSVYLKAYARVYGKAIYHARTLREIQLFHSGLSFVTDGESAVRLDYLARAGMTDDDIERIAPLPENRRYIGFLLDAAATGDVCTMTMAVLPCMLSYSYIFRRIAAMPGTEESCYLDFIRDYAGEEYVESGRLWCDFAGQRCGGLPERERAELARVFERASLLELDFWRMAYRGQPGETTK